MALQMARVFRRCAKHKTLIWILNDELQFGIAQGAHGNKCNEKQRQFCNRWRESSMEPTRSLREHNMYAYINIGQHSGLFSLYIYSFDSSPIPIFRCVRMCVCVYVFICKLFSYAHNFLCVAYTVNKATLYLSLKSISFWLITVWV